jgi:cupin 2 domain-containing protein
METGNLLHNIPDDLPDEIADTLLLGAGIRIERIVSNGQCSAPGFWYDQPQGEWVLLVQGEARLRFERDDQILHLTPGAYVNIGAHEKHRVEWTAEDRATIWLAVFY